MEKSYDKIKMTSYNTDRPLVYSGSRPLVHDGLSPLAQFRKEQSYVKPSRVRRFVKRLANHVLEKRMKDQFYDNLIKRVKRDEDR